MNVSFVIIRLLGGLRQEFCDDSETAVLLSFQLPVLSQFAGQRCRANFTIAAGKIKLAPATTNHERILSCSQELEFL